MNKDILLKDLEKYLDTFQVHIQKIKHSDDELHLIDIALFCKMTIEIYEHLNKLESVLSKHSADQLITVNLPEKTPKGEIPEQVQVIESEKKKIKEEEDSRTEVKMEKEEIPSVDLSKEKPRTNEPSEPEDEFIPSAKIKSRVEKQPDNEKDKKPETNKTEVSQPILPESDALETTKTTIDLFSENAEKTLGDKFGSVDESSIADKMQKSQVNDLREVIGINEKFLFINELFNGDMSRYNKIIDELNELTTQQGINAYLIELKVAHQWQEENEAFNKFKDLLERKIS